MLKSETTHPLKVHLPTYAFSSFLVPILLGVGFLIHTDPLEAGGLPGGQPSSGTRLAAQARARQ